MRAKRFRENRLKSAVFGCLFAVVGVLVGFSGVVMDSTPVYADPVETVQTEENTAGEDLDEANSGIQAAENKSEGENCKDSLGSIGWLVCPTTGKISEAVDWLYDRIETILVIKPVEMKDGSPIYEIWKYMLGITNIIFIIFLLVVVCSQLTGYGISNYGLKKILPKLIVVAILVNLSFVICSIAVDASNIVGDSLRGIFTSIEESTMSSINIAGGMKMSEMYSALAGGSVLAIGAGAIAFETGAIWMLIPTVLGAIVSVVIGLVTIAMRQAVVALLIMIAPLAIVAYMLPNTEKWFKKWKDLLTKMLIFYPMFSLLFGASSLAGWAIIASATDGFGVILGVAVQIFPLFFAWSLMKMSGTILGTINSKLTGLTARPLAMNRAWAESRKAQTSAHYMQYGKSPYSHLRRFLDNRKNLRETHTKNLQSLRTNEANIYTQRKISNGYDGTKATETSKNLTPNKYTRTAKDLANSNLAAETAAMDTKHTLDNYESYFVSEKVRKAVKAATDSNNKKDLKALMSDPEHRRAATGANNYLEYSRAKMTAENDSEADFNFMVDNFVNAAIGDDPEKKRNLSEEELKERHERYRHYIASSAGGLGEVGQVRVLGKIIAQAAAVESSQRRDINIVAAKFPPDKSKFRNMLVGYHVDDNGYAVDKNGEVLEGEKYRGYLLKHDPDKLVLWDKVDENGPYYDWYDTNNNYVTRIYKKDKSAIKELLSNYDAPINDPINNLYGILAGIKQGDIKGKDDRLKYIGLDSFRTTVGRAILSAPFKEKNAAFSPMVAEMINKGYIKNYATEYLAYLDSLNKATKPGAFNVQDSDAIAMFATIMNPENWNEIFAKDLVKDFKNINGKPLTGLRYVYNEEAGEMEAVDVPFEEATQEEVIEKIKTKFLIPAARKMTTMMSRQTSNTADNQKAGTIKEWKNLKDIFDNKWGKGKMVEIDPYEQAGDMRKIAYDIKQKLHEGDKDNRFKRYEDIRFMYEHQIDNDADALFMQYITYCDKHPEDLSMVKSALTEWMNDKIRKRIDFSTTELVEYMEDLLNQFMNLD